jgi:glucose/arabinose dehydrogenase
VSPSYAADRRVFVYTSTDRDNRVLRMTFEDGRLGSPTAILTGIPHGFIHDGGRMTFGPDGYLYVSTGETGSRDLAQREDSLGGKILRITQDGAPAPGNPDPRSPVWTLGHRNVQGLAFDDAGHLWASEFGQDTWDELNLIEKGTNYGWPEVEGRGTSTRFRNPQVVWHTDEASPSGLAYLDGRLWLASLRGERLWRIDVTGRRASNPVDFFVGRYGRMRTVTVAPDGNLWVTTSNRDGRGDPAPGDDRILLVRP